MNSINVLNSIIIIGLLIAALCVVLIDEILPCIIASSVAGTFLALEFLILGAPDVAITEGVVGAILTPVIFIIAITKIKKYDKNKKEETK